MNSFQSIHFFEMIPGFEFQNSSTPLHNKDFISKK